MKVTTGRAIARAHLILNIARTSKQASSLCRCEQLHADLDFSELYVQLRVICTYLPYKIAFVRAIARTMLIRSARANARISQTVKNDAL